MLSHGLDILVTSPDQKAVEREVSSVGCRVNVLKVRQRVYSLPLSVGLRVPLVSAIYAKRSFALALPDGLYRSSLITSPATGSGEGVEETSRLEGAVVKPVTVSP